MNENKIPNNCPFIEGIDTCKLTECSKNIIGMCTKKGSKNYPEIRHRTQFERIKLMSVDEVAEFIRALVKCSFHNGRGFTIDCKDCPVRCTKSNAINYTKEYLESEVEE